MDESPSLDYNDMFFYITVINVQSVHSKFIIPVSQAIDINPIRSLYLFIILEKKLMKIAMLAPFGIHPKGTVLSRMLPLGYALAKKGNEVALVIPQEENVSVTTPFCGGSLRLLSIPMGSRRDVIDDIGVSYEMMRRASSLEPDIIHVFKPKGYSGLAGMFKRVGGTVGNEKIPLVLDGDDYEGFGGINDVMDYPAAWKMFFHFQEMVLPRICDRMTLASTYLMDYYSGFGANRDHMLHLPNGVNPFIHSPNEIDEGLMKLLSEPPLDGKERNAAEKEGALTFTDEILENQVPEETIALFSRFRDHGTARVLNIFRSVQKENRRAKFLLVGDGASGESVHLQKEMKKNLKKGTFLFTGRFPFTSINKVFSHSNIAMVPMDDSNITRSKCSAKLVDLMAMGKAVVADNVGENGNYIEDGISGYLVHNIVGCSFEKKNKGPSYRTDCGKKNTKEFTERLLYFLDNPEGAKKMGRKARTRVNSKFSWKVLADKVDDLYREL